MGIRNPDGSQYNVSGSMQQFDPENPEHDLFNAWDQEVIKIGGSPVFYHEVFIQSGTVDPQYWEDRGKIYSPVGVELWCYYEPLNQSNNQGAFGFDGADDMLFEFNYKSVLDTIGHPPKMGSRLFTPHKSENWIIVQRKLDQFKLWGEIRLQLVCQRFQESTTTEEGKVTQQKTDFKIN